MRCFLLRHRQPRGECARGGGAGQRCSPPMRGGLGGAGDGRIRGRGVCGRHAAFPERRWQRQPLASFLGSHGRCGGGADGPPPAMTARPQPAGWGSPLTVRHVRLARGGACLCCWGVALSQQCGGGEQGGRQNPITLPPLLPSPLSLPPRPPLLSPPLPCTTTHARPCRCPALTNFHIFRTRVLSTICAKRVCAVSDISLLRLDFACAHAQTKCNARFDPWELELCLACLLVGARY